MQLEKTGSGYEAWVLLKPDYEQQVHLNSHLVEYGIANVSSNASQCLSHEELETAKTIARSEKLGIWSR